MTEEAARPPAVVLLSGGLDSATVLAVCRSERREVFALSFQYGQRHALELQFARRQASAQGVADHRVVDLSSLSALVADKTALVEDSSLVVPTGGVEDGIPVTYVPARNTLFLSYGLAWAESLEAREIWIGVNAVDYSGYPDCRPEFIDAFESLANLATRVGVETEFGPAIRIRAPLQGLSKAQIIELGLELGVDYGQTLSCYQPASDATPCGVCDSCRLRQRGFQTAGHPDPALRKRF